MRTFKALIFILIALSANAQNTAKSRILIDTGHGQRFWKDPATVTDPDFLERIRYMAAEFGKTAASVDAQFGYIKEFTPEQLKTCDLVFIQTPSVPYSNAEVKALQDFINNGGSMFLVMDVDYWSTLEQTNVNDIIKLFGLSFGSDNKTDTLSGGYTKVSEVTPDALRIPAHGFRDVSGGKPIAFSKNADLPIGKFKNVKNGGKIIVMGEGMVSLYMTAWEDVTDYQCQEFMQAAFRWLLEK